MSDLKIKICGVKNKEIAQHAIDAGASFIGFIFYEKSHRNITVENCEEILSKIKDLKKIQEETKKTFDIEVDGGINFENSKLVIEAGANILVSGTTIFKSNNGDIKKNIELLKSS